MPSLYVLKWNYRGCLFAGFGGGGDLFFETQTGISTRVSKPRLSLGGPLEAEQQNL